MMITKMKLIILHSTDIKRMVVKQYGQKNLEKMELIILDFKFRINGENKTGKDLAGIRWIEGTKTYFLSLSE